MNFVQGPARQAVVPIDRSISAQKERSRQIVFQRQLPHQQQDGVILPATPGQFAGAIASRKDPQIELARQNARHGAHQHMASSVTGKSSIPNENQLNQFNKLNESSNSNSMMNSNSNNNNNINGNNNSNSNSNNAHNKEEDLSESNYDPFSGYCTSLFSAGNYDDEDKEADEIFAAIDKRMDSKRKRRREEKERKQWADYHKKKPKIREYFHKERNELSSLSLETWENIPEAADLSRRRRQMAQASKMDSRQKYTPVPDAIIDSARQQAQQLDSTQSGVVTSVDQVELEKGGWTTSFVDKNSSNSNSNSNSNSHTTDLTLLGRARDTHLGLQLDKMADSVKGQTVVDPKGYLTDLTAFRLGSDSDVSDIRKVRQLLKSIINTNPWHAPGWIAATRLEHLAGKIQAARTMILRATDACPTSEDIWLEAVKLHDAKQGKSILARAVNNIPKSVNLWMKACELENDVSYKKSILRKALEFIPNSVKLWKEAIELEEDKNEAKALLSAAVDCVPKSVELWLALANLQDYTEAKKVLNRANKKTTDPSIFIASAKLEEKNNHFDQISRIISLALQSLRQHKVVIDRDMWMSQAAKCERSGYPHTCQAIVNAVIDIDVEEQDRRDTWSQEAKEWTKKGRFELARAIYGHMLTKFPDKWKIWFDAAMLEKACAIKARQSGSGYGLNSKTTTNNQEKKDNDIEIENDNENDEREIEIDKCDELLEKALKHCPNAKQLWILRAKEKWTRLGDIDGAKQVLFDGLKENPGCESIWLAAIKIEQETNNFDKARNLLSEARKECGTANVWMKSAKLERGLNNLENEEKLLSEALERYPNFDKLWLMRAQLAERLNDYKTARAVCQAGVEKNSKCARLWLEYARIEASNNKIAKARSVLENGRIKLAKCDELYLGAAKLELIADRVLNNEMKGFIKEYNNCYLPVSNKLGNELTYTEGVSSQGIQMAQSMLAKGLQACPDSGLLNAFVIELEPAVSKKSKIRNAIRNSSVSNVFVFTQVARYFYENNVKLSKAREWFERAISSDKGSDWGDAWAYYLHFLRKHGTQTERRKLITRCLEAEPKHGLLWTVVSKQIGNEKLDTKQILVRVVRQLIECKFDHFKVKKEKESKSS